MQVSLILSDLFRLGVLGIPDRPRDQGCRVGRLAAAISIATGSIGVDGAESLAELQTRSGSDTLRQVGDRGQLPYTVAKSCPS